MNSFFRSALFPLIVIVLLVYLASQTLMDDRAPTTQITYPEAERLLRDHPERVDEITLRPREKTAEVLLVSGVKAKTPSPDTNTSTPWWWYGLIGSFLLVAVVVQVGRHRRRAEEDLTAQVRNRSTA